LEKDEFPGSILMRLGAGERDLADDTKEEWHNALKSSNQKSAYQLRCHVYQGRDMPASDANGLMDPYFKVNFNGQRINTKSTQEIKNGHKQTYRLPSQIKKATIDPLWYSTVCFDCELPGNPDFFPQVNVQVFDYDFGPFDADDYAGCANCTLGKEHVVSIEEAETKILEPKWYKMLKEVEGDCEGELLLSFQLIKKAHPESEMPSMDNFSIVPEYKKSYIEIISIGCRDLSPFQMQPTQFPCVEFKVDSGSGSHVALTNNSKRPSGSNPNFLERTVMEVMLPEKSIFAPPLSLKLYDNRLAGMYKPVCGVARIDLSKKLPWSPDYTGPQRVRHKSDVKAAAGAVVMDRLASNQCFAHTSQKDLQKRKASDTRVEKEFFGSGGSIGGGETSFNEALNLAQHVPSDIKETIDQKMVEEDNGAGVFGALKHVDLGKSKAGSANIVSSSGERGTFGRQERAGSSRLLSEDGTETESRRGSRSYSKGEKSVLGMVYNKEGKGKVRKATQTELEEEFDLDEEEDEAPPKYMQGREKLPSELEDILETSPFETFHFHRGQGEGRKQVGVFKGLVRIMADKDEKPLFDLDALLKPKLYEVRLYVTRGLSFTPMDLGFNGRPGKSDPYLKVNIGKDEFNDRKNYISDAVDVDFYKMVELHTELPGAGLLEIECMDYDAFGPDDLIGKTVIDLEDRWFDQKWQSLGSENAVNEIGKMRWPTKPLERRSLYIPTSNNPQGNLECWVDIIPQPDAPMYPPDDIALPPAVMFEVRVVVWRAVDMISMDALEDMNDLYFTGWVEGCDKQSTDTHWRAKNGKGSFNWRMKFDVELGHNTKAMKFPYLHMQAWDKDIVKYNDCIAESMIMMDKAFKRAYKKNARVDMFVPRDLEKEREARAFAKKQREMMEKSHQDRKAEHAMKLGERDDDDDESEPLLNMADANGVSRDGTEVGRMSSVREEEEEEENEERASEASNVDLESGNSEVGIEMIPKGSERSDSLTVPKGGAGNARAANRSSRGMSYEGMSLTTNKKEKRKAKADKEREERENTKIRRKRAAQAKKEEMASLIGNMKEFCGIPGDPPNSTWLTLERKDYSTGETVNAGKVAISISIVPKALADSNPVGFGRNEPNNDPYLPGPTGRLKFTLNPFSMGSQLLGPVLCAKFACCCCSIFLIIVLYFLAPFIQIFLQLKG